MGNIRDVEVMISGTKGNYDLVLRTGAWGKDIMVPTAIWGARDGRISRCSSSSTKFTGRMHLKSISGILLEKRQSKLATERQKFLAQ